MRRFEHDESQAGLGPMNVVMQFSVGTSTYFFVCQVLRRNADDARMPGGQPGGGARSGDLDLQPESAPVA